VDVAAVRPDELEPGDGEPSASPGDGATGGRRGVAVLGALVLVLAVLVALLVVELSGGSESSADQAAADAAAAARAEALALTTISYRSADADLDRILAGATGKLHQQFAEERPHFADTLRPDKSESKGDVLAVGVVDVAPDDGTAQVDVAADATVTTTSAAGKSRSVLKHYRMVMQLVRTDGRWLVSDVAFAGAPQ
jgi:Mce-associated membrane protein